jgi:hypothetical protein
MSDGHRRPIGEIQVNLAHQYRFCRWGFIPSDERKILYIKNYVSFERGGNRME